MQSISHICLHVCFYNAKLTEQGNELDNEVGSRIGVNKFCGVKFLHLRHSIDRDEVVYWGKLTVNREMVSTERSLFTNHDFNKEELCCADSAHIIYITSSFSEWEYLGEMNGGGTCLAHALYVATQLEMGEEREDKAGREKTKICKSRGGRGHTMGSLQRTISSSPR